MTNAENLQLIFEQKQPEWVPIWKDSVCHCRPSFFSEWRPAHPEVRKVYKNFFGISYEYSDPKLVPIASPTHHLFEDITEWKKYFVLPDVSGIDWDAMAEADMKGVSREGKMSCLWIGATVLAYLLDAMGHENTLVAMMEEEEAWHELQTTVCDWWCDIIQKCIRAYKADMVIIADDMGFGKAPFMSLSAYREMIKPYMSRYVKTVRDAGCNMVYHSCGKCEPFIGDWIDMGIQLWECQPVNDFDAMKKQYGNQLALLCAWDSTAPAAQPGASEELVRQTVRDMIDQYGQGGGFVFNVEGRLFEWLVGSEHYGWVYDEARKYGKLVYQR